MKKLTASLIGTVVVSMIIASTAAPAFALGGCGANYHRNAAGQCVWGGQNQSWCVRTTGHEAVRAPNGRLVCVR